MRQALLLQKLSWQLLRCFQFCSTLPYISVNLRVTVFCWFGRTVSIQYFCHSYNLLPWNTLVLRAFYMTSLEQTASAGRHLFTCRHPTAPSAWSFVGLASSKLRRMFFHSLFAAKNMHAMFVSRTNLFKINLKDVLSSHLQNSTVAVNCLHLQVIIALLSHDKMAGRKCILNKK